MYSEASSIADPGVSNLQAGHCNYLAKTINLGIWRSSSVDQKTDRKPTDEPMLSSPTTWQLSASRTSNRCRALTTALEMLKTRLHSLASDQARVVLTLATTTPRHQPTSILEPLHDSNNTHNSQWFSIDFDMFQSAQSGTYQMCGAYINTRQRTPQRRFDNAWALESSYTTP